MFDALKHPPAPSNVISSVARENTLTHREISDSYSNIVVQLEPRWRVIVCKNAIQWILQKRSSKPLNKGIWVGVSYLTTRNSLIAICSGRRLLSDPKARAVLEALPARISDYRK